MTNNNTIHELKQRKAQLEQNIERAITKELISFRTDTGMSPNGVDVSVFTTKTLGSSSEELLVGGVDCPMEI